MASVVPVAYQNTSSSPEWLNKGDNAWQMTSATLVGLQSMPGLVILYGSIVKKKWAINSAFMALYAFAAVWLCWVTWAYHMSFGDKLLPFWGKARPALDQKFLIAQSTLPASTHYYHNGDVETAMITPFYPAASMVYFQCVFAAITAILLAGSLLGRMNFLAWMVFVPLWITFSYTIGAFSIWGGGFLFQWGVIDYSGGYVIHVSSGIAGFTAAYWVCIRVVQGWAAIVMGVLSGSIPWFTMNVIHRHWSLLQAIDDTLGVFHTHAVAGVLGGISTGLFAEEVLCNLFLPVTNSHGAVYGGGVGGSQLGKQIAGALFIIGWNVVVTSIICLVIKLVIPLRIPDDQLLIGDDAVHGEEA